MKKNRLNRLKFWKNRPIRFQFYKPVTENTEPNPNRKKIGKKTKPKPTQTEKTEQNRKNRPKTNPNRFCPKKPNRNQSVWTGSVRFQFFFFLISVWLFFFDKNWTELKMITPSCYHVLRLFFSTSHKWRIS